MGAHLENPRLECSKCSGKGKRGFWNNDCDACKGSGYTGCACSWVYRCVSCKGRGRLDIGSGFTFDAIVDPLTSSTTDSPHAGELIRFLGFQETCFKQTEKKQTENVPEADTKYTVGQVLELGMTQEGDAPGTYVDWISVKVTAADGEKYTVRPLTKIECSHLHDFKGYEKLEQKYGFTTQGKCSKCLISGKTSELATQNCCKACSGAWQGQEWTSVPQEDLRLPVKYYVGQKLECRVQHGNGYDQWWIPVTVTEVNGREGYEVKTISEREMLQSDQIAMLKDINRIRFGNDEFPNKPLTIEDVPESDLRELQPKQRRRLTNNHVLERLLNEISRRN